MLPGYCSVAAALEGAARWPLGRARVPPLRFTWLECLGELAIMQTSSTLLKHLPAQLSNAGLLWLVGVAPLGFGAMEEGAADAGQARPEDDSAMEVAQAPTNFWAWSSKATLAWPQPELRLTISRRW